MRTTQMQILARALTLLALTGSLVTAAPIDNAFTYQGRLTEEGEPATGWYSIRFSLWDAAASGHLLALPLLEERVAASNGLFTVLLDFGVDALGQSHFRGNARWLEIEVDHYRGTNFTTLQPRQPLTPTPYALFAPAAGSAPADGITGTLPDARLSTNVARLDSSPTFKGSVTANNELLALRLHIGVSCDASGSLATIAGGFCNTNLGALSFLGQGMRNTIQTNTVRAFLGGGTGNTIQRSADYSFLGGGSDNTIQTDADYSFLGGGSGNTIQPDADFSFLGGGNANTIRSNTIRAVLGGGAANTIRTNANYATLGGGYLNDIGGAYATVPGGANNDAWGEYSFAAGRRAKAEHPGAFVWADSTGTEFSSSLDNQFAVRANGGMYVEGSGGFSAPQLHLRQTDSGSWARLHFSVSGVSNFWNISMQPKNSPDLRFSNLTNTVSFGADGSVTADAFDGDGSKLTGLNANAITTGTLPDARLSAKVARLVDGRITADAFDGDGSRLTGLNANAITTGKMPDAQLPDNVARLNKGQTFTGWNTFNHLVARDVAGTGGSIHVGSAAYTDDPNLIKFGDGSLVTIGEDGADDRMQLTATAFAFLPSDGLGNVGIGKTNPATALDVNGTVTATAFTGTNGAPLTLHAPDGSKALYLRNDAFGAGKLSIYNDLGQTIELNGRNPLYKGGEIKVAGVVNNNVRNTIEIRGTADASNTGGEILVKQGDGTTTIQLDGEVGADGGGYMSLNKGDGTTGIVLAAQSTLNGGQISVHGGNGAETIEILGTADASNSGGQILFRKANGTTSIQLDGEVGADGGGYISLYKGDGTTGVIITAQDSNGESRVTTQVLEITGGSDLSEQFDVQPTEIKPEPGMLVRIDPVQPGQLAVSTRAYDHTVAGIISGAGGIKPGMLMGQKGSVANGKYPVALSGRVYCLADADAGAIEPGDLITTSNTPGHGMKVRDPARGQGAIIGKAMTRLEHGRGLVLVLVSLQ